MFDVSILLRLVDRLTSPSRKAGQSYKAMAQSITNSSKQIQAASAGAAAGFGRVGAAATKAQASINAYYSSLHRRQAQMKSPRGSNTVVGGNQDTFRAIGAWMTLRNSVTAAEDTAKSENKFRALVDDVTPQKLLDIREILDARMMKSGETYAELLDAAGDAAQIVGRSDIAAQIAVAASKLTNIDTAGKTVAEFSGNLAAIIGPNGTLEELRQVGNMLAMQQKLGAATAGGTIEAYKNVVGSKGIYKFDQADMLTAIGMIKNTAPALQDSQIGNMAKYGIRTLAAPIQDMRKKLKRIGLTPESFMTDGAFDIAKTQQLFAKMISTEKGLKRFKNLFAGRNVLAGEFWSYLANMDPAKFAEYRDELMSKGDALDEADDIRLEGLIEALNKIRASIWMTARAFGQGLTPAIVQLSDVIGPAAQNFSAFMAQSVAQYPQITGAVTAWIGLVAALSAVGVFSARAAAAAGFLFKLPFRVFGGVLTGVVRGVAGAIAAIFGIGKAAAVAGGALGLLRFALGSAFRMSAIWGAVKGITWVYENWDKLKQLAKDPIKFDVIFPEAPDWIKWLWGNSLKQQELMDISQTQTRQRTDGWIEGFTNFWKRGDASDRGLDHWSPSFAGIGTFGVPEAMLRRPNDADGKSGVAATPQAVTNTTNSNNSIVNNVTVNVSQSNADPASIGNATANAVGSKVRGALSDAPHSAP